MDGIATFATFLEYKGRKLLLRSAGDTWACVQVDGELTLDRFPEALEFSSDPDDEWVVLPRAAFDASFRQEAFGLWHGVRVAIESVVRHGLQRGLVNVRYDGKRPDEAIAAGLRGNQNDGWSATVDPLEITDVVVTETMYPMVRS